MASAPHSAPTTASVPLSELRVVSLPEQELVDHLSARVPGFRYVLWDMAGDPVGARAEEIDVAVAPYVAGPWLGALSAAPRLRLLQLQGTGFDGVAEAVGPDLALSSAGWVHAAGTAELALGLILAAQRELDRAVLQQRAGLWRRFATRSLADSRVLVLGAGEIGSAVVDRLLPFEVEVVRVASRAGTDERGPVRGVDELPALLPGTDVLVVALPASPATDRLVDARVLSRLPDDALVVNVGRGRVVDTPALTEEVVSGRLRCALDVVEPEPFPGDHPLFRAPGAILTPHTGGSSTSYRPRVRRLLRMQLERIAAGERPLFLQQEGRLAVPGPDAR
ncbi:NAD(P)-dependent oxidoreductase [Kocuria sp. CPCC 205268]|uniref:NAD(P)-dependent oxidoreductase n=1 Tax=Kocuria oxytropis TaxID=3058913 RepID=UPI0034D45388